MTKAKNKPEKVFLNPFSNEFLPSWEMWKLYKKEEFKFSYKSSITEQAAIDHLVDISSGKEHIAVSIIKQSISNGWKGLFELKNIKNNGEKFIRNSQYSLQPGGQDPTRIATEGIGEL